MGKSSPSAPTPPDPFQSAAAQWALNNNTFNALNDANRYNVVTPFGTRTWSKTVHQNPGSSAGAGKSTAQSAEGASQSGGTHMVNAGGDASQYVSVPDDNGQDSSGPGGGNSYYQQALDAVNGDPNTYDWTETDALNPDDQTILNLQRQTNIGLGNTAVKQLGQIQGMLGTPMNFNSAPAQVLGVQAGPLQNTVAGAGPLATSINTSGVPGLVGGNALAAQQQQVNNALYSQAASRLDPQWTNSQHDLEAQLANEGINRTTNPDAWNRAMQQFNNAKTDAYNQANYSAIGQGVNAMNTLFGEGATANSQLFGQAASQAGLQNNAQQQLYGQNANNTQVYNAAQAQNFQQAMANANLQNQGRQQSINETTALRNQPLAELNSLVRGTPIQQGNFGNSYQQGTLAAPNIQNAIQQNYQAQLGQYNADVAQDNSTLGGLFSLGGAAIKAGMFSSIEYKTEHAPVDHGDTLARLKQVQVGRWTYRPEFGGTRHIGPYAEDFSREFGGAPDRIAIQDAFGVCLSAIKGLTSQLEALAAEVESLRAPAQPSH